jgi:hypothetical protein
MDISGTETLSCSELHDFAHSFKQQLDEASWAHVVKFIHATEGTVDEDQFVDFFMLLVSMAQNQTQFDYLLKIQKVKARKKQHATIAGRIREMQLSLAGLHHQSSYSSQEQHAIKHSNAGRSSPFTPVLSPANLQREYDGNRSDQFNRSQGITLSSIDPLSPRSATKARQHHVWNAHAGETTNLASAPVLEQSAATNRSEDPRETAARVIQTRFRKILYSSNDNTCNNDISSSIDVEQVKLTDDSISVSSWAWAWRQKLRRHFSVGSRDMLQSLDQLDERIEHISSEVEETEAQLNNQPQKLFALKGTIAQLNGILEKVQCKEIDSLLVGGLVSGQNKSRQRRKDLTQKVELLADRVQKAHILCSKVIKPCVHVCMCAVY